MYLIESVIFSALIALVNYLYYPLSFLFIGDAANPYQILSICMSVRYGSLKGFVSFVIITASGLAAAAMSGNASKIFEPDSAYFIFSALLTAHIAGQIKDHQDYRYSRLKSGHDKLSSEFEKCALNCLMLEDANKELTKKIVTRFQSLSTVYEAAKKLETLEYDKLFPAVLHILESHINVRAAAVFLKEKDGFALKACSAKISAEEKFEPDLALFARAVASGKTVSLLDNLMQPYQPIEVDGFENYIIAAPVLFNGEVYGVIAVREIPFDNLTDTSVRMVSMIAEWTAMCLNKIDNFTQIESEVPVDSRIKCYKPDHLRQLIKSEVFKAMRYRLELSVCKISILSHEKIPEENKTSIYFSIGYIIKNSIREIDLYGACMQSGCFIIILPVTDARGAGILLSRLISEIGNFRLKPYENGEDLRFEAEAHSLFETVSEERLRSIPFEKLNEESFETYRRILEHIKF